MLPRPIGPFVRWRRLASAAAASLLLASSTAALSGCGALLRVGGGGSSTIAFATGELRSQEPHPVVELDRATALAVDTLGYEDVDTEREPPSVLVDKIMSVEQAQGSLRVSVSAELVIEETTTDMIRVMRETLIQHRGDDQVYYSFLRAADQQKAGPFRVGGHLKVKGDDKLRTALLSVLGPNAKVHIGARL